MVFCIIICVSKFVYTLEGGSWNENIVIVALSVSKSMQDMMTFEHYHVSIRHLVCTNVLVYAHACVFVTYRSSENNSVHGCMYIYMCMFVSVTATSICSIVFIVVFVC